MTPRKVYGSTLLASTLERLGVELIFGLPGSQNIALYEAFRKSKIRTILPTNEMAASFMANGYARASGKTGVVVTIPGPGFTYALTGMAEAYLDSAPVLWIAGKPADSPGNRYQLQAIDQKTVARPIVKETLSVESISELAPKLVEAYTLTARGEPGPVLIEVANSVFSEIAPEHLEPAPFSVRPSDPPDPELVHRSVQKLASSKRVLLYVGAGCAGAAEPLRKLAELLVAPVLTTTSGRGVVPEDHPLVFLFDSDSGDIEVINRFIESCDLVLALGCKFSHNGSHGFRLRIPREKLIHVDSSEAVLGANYPAQLPVVGDVGLYLDSLLRNRDWVQSRSSDWSDQELKRWHDEIHREQLRESPEPEFTGISPSSPRAFFLALREALPADSCLVTDSGLHQMLARKYFKVLTPRGLLIPSNFQSMGFGLPAGIGAKLASPEKDVLVLMGDGAFAISGMEILTAVREKIQLTVIVFNDGQLGLIRLSQLASYGHSFATGLKNPDFSMFAKAVGTNYFRMTGDPRKIFTRCFESPGVSLLEVGLEDSPAFLKMRTKGMIKEGLGRVLGPNGFEQMKKWKSGNR